MPAVTCKHRSHGSTTVAHFAALLAHCQVPCRGKNAVANSYTCYKISVNFHITYYNATLQSHTFVGEMYDSRSNFTTKVGIASGLITHTGPQPDNSTHVYSYDGIAFAFGGELNIIYVNLLDNNKVSGVHPRTVVVVNRFHGVPAC